MQDPMATQTQSSMYLNPWQSMLSHPSMMGTGPQGFVDPSSLSYYQNSYGSNMSNIASSQYGQIHSNAFSNAALLNTGMVAPGAGMNMSMLRQHQANASMNMGHSMTTTGIGLMGGFAGATIGSRFGAIGGVIGGIVGEAAGSMVGVLAEDGLNTLSGVHRSMGLLANPDSPYGGGYGHSTSDAKDVYSSIQDMSMDDITFSQQEIGRILNEGIKTGQISGGSTDQIKTKLKELKETAKGLASMFGTNDISEIMDHMRKLGGSGLMAADTKQVAADVAVAARALGVDAQQYGVAYEARSKAKSDMGGHSEQMNLLLDARVDGFMSLGDKTSLLFGGSKDKRAKVSQELYQIEANLFGSSTTSSVLLSEQNTMSKEQIVMSSKAFARESFLNSDRENLTKEASSSGQPLSSVVTSKFEALSEKEKRKFYDIGNKKVLSKWEDKKGMYEDVVSISPDVFSIRETDAYSSFDAQALKNATQDDSKFVFSNTDLANKSIHSVFKAIQFGFGKEESIGTGNISTDVYKLANAMTEDMNGGVAKKAQDIHDQMKADREQKSILMNTNRAGFIEKIYRKYSNKATDFVVDISTKAMYDAEFSGTAESDGMSKKEIFSKYSKEISEGKSGLDKRFSLDSMLTQGGRSFSALAWMKDKSATKADTIVNSSLAAVGDYQVVIQESKSQALAQLMAGEYSKDKRNHGSETKMQNLLSVASGKISVDEWAKNRDIRSSQIQEDAKSFKSTMSRSTTNRHRQLKNALTEFDDTHSSGYFNVAVMAKDELFYSGRRVAKNKVARVNKKPKYTEKVSSYLQSINQGSDDDIKTRLEFAKKLESGELKKSIDEKGFSQVVDDFMSSDANKKLSGKRHIADKIKNSNGDIKSLYSDMFKDTAKREKFKAGGADIKSMLDSIGVNVSGNLSKDDYLDTKDMLRDGKFSKQITQLLGEGVDAKKIQTNLANAIDGNEKALALANSPFAGQVTQLYAADKNNSPLQKEANHSLKFRKGLVGFGELSQERKEAVLTAAKGAAAVTKGDNRIEHALSIRNKLDSYSDLDEEEKIIATNLSSYEDIGDVDLKNLSSFAASTDMSGRFMKEMRTITGQSLRTEDDQGHMRDAFALFKEEEDGSFDLRTTSEMKEVLGGDGKMSSHFKDLWEEKFNESYNEKNASEKKINSFQSFIAENAGMGGKLDAFESSLNGGASMKATETLLTSIDSTLAQIAKNTENKTSIKSTE